MTEGKEKNELIERPPPPVSSQNLQTICFPTQLLWGYGKAKNGAKKDVTLVDAWAALV